MFQCILSASRIKCITVCQKWHTTLLFAQVCNNFCIIRAKKCHISKLTKMHLNCYKFSIHINIIDTGCHTELS